jgi:hypothetical protein
MRGTSIGRFVILSRLGEGGMGVVFTAYDPELDRQCSIRASWVTPPGPRG